jgi:hypothetical protein
MVERDFLLRKSDCSARAEIGDDRTTKPALSGTAVRTAGLNRAALYYRRAEVSADELGLMALIDRQCLRTPFYGSRRMTPWLRTQGYMVYRKRAQPLMRLMGIEPVYQRQRTSLPTPGDRIYPYLLRGRVIERVNQVWAADICYVAMVSKRGRGTAWNRCLLRFLQSRAIAPSPRLPRPAPGLRRSAAASQAAARDKNDNAKLAAQ